MRILQVFDGYGGPEERVLPNMPSTAKVVYHLAINTLKRGHDVIVLERSFKKFPSVEVIDTLKYVRIDAEKLPAPPYNLIKRPSGVLKLLADGCVIAKKIDGFLKRENFDVIHVHFPFASSILINLKRKLRRNTIYTAHIGEEKRRLNLNGSAPFILKIFSPDLYLMKKVRKIVVLNESLKKKIIAKGINEEKIEVIPNGVNVKEFDMPKEKIERVKMRYCLDRLTVMFAGTITPRKGVEYLVKAGEILKNEKVLFLIVGNLNLDREYAEKVMEYVKKKNLNAKFTGFVPYDDLKTLYSACDIFVLPSFEEGDPIALKEALASGKPLVGSNVGGIPMQIRDGWNGFLVEPANERQLAERIEYLIENEDERIRMGRNSRKLAEEEFDWDKITEKYLKVYESIVHSGFT